MVVVVGIHFVVPLNIIFRNTQQHFYKLFMSPVPVTVDTVTATAATVIWQGSHVDIYSTITTSRLDKVLYI